jgi:acyl-CoA thioesterase-1
MITILSLVTACSAVVTVDEYPDGSLVCFGDSLTAGYGASVPQVDDKTKSYPAFLQAKVTLPVVNSGVSGDTTGGAYGRVSSDVLAKNPKIVVVELGANDLFQLVPAATTKSNFESILTAIKNNNNPKIYLAKFYTEEIARSLLANEGISNTVMQDAIISGYDTIFSELSADYNAELITTIWDDVWGVDMSDQIHPNAVGYEKMADNYFEAMRGYLVEKGFAVGAN